MNVAVIGCGLIDGRAKSLAPGKVVLCVDVVAERAAGLAAEIKRRTQQQLAGCDRTNRHRDAAGFRDAQRAGGDHSGGRPSASRCSSKASACLAREITPILKACESTALLVRVGFNHRYHPAFLKAREIVDSGALGPLMFVRGRYGHGGRVGYDKEWRARPELSGGGELIDQGVHLIDLARHFLGDFVSVQGFAHTYFWNMPVEDNGFLLLKTAGEQTAFLHASCSEWKNTFAFEIYGRAGKLEINGLGGSYGVERLTHYQMLLEMARPKRRAGNIPAATDHGRSSCRNFRKTSARAEHPAAGLRDAQRGAGNRRRSVSAIKHPAGRGACGHSLSAGRLTCDRPIQDVDEADMIITRSPLRISLGGGGTDLPSYYQEHSGFLIAAAIDNMSISPCTEPSCRN